MTVDDVLFEIEKISGVSRLAADTLNYFKPTEAERTKLFEEWSGKAGMPVASLLNDIASRVALDFYEGRISWLFGDTVANFIFSEIVDQQMPDDSIAWRTYIAFDLGEYGDSAFTSGAIDEFIPELKNPPNLG